ncbi:MAG: flagellar assembly protein FliW, partial [Pirellulales bacterium]
MEIATSRFGTLRIERDDTIRFPNGILGMEECRQWVLLADAQNDSLGWLQSAHRPHIALAVVSPRRFVPDYQIRVARRELSPLELEQPGDAQVLVAVAKNGDAVTLNLKAPLVLNLAKRFGCQ